MQLSCQNRSLSTPAQECTLTSRCSRVTPTPSLRWGGSTNCQRLAVSSSPVCSGTPPRSRRSPTSSSTPTNTYYALMKHQNFYFLNTPTTGQSARVESRAIDSAATPYLTFSLLLAAGLRGIEEAYELPPEASDNVWELSDTERRALGYSPLPKSLDHAIESMEASELVAETLGEQVFSYVLANKRSEWHDYRAQVTPFELRRNLKIL